MQKMAAEFEEKPAEAVRKYTSLYNKQSPDFKDKSKKVLSQDDLCKRIHFLAFLFRRREIRSKIPISSNSSSSSWSAILADRVQIHMRKMLMLMLMSQCESALKLVLLVVKCEIYVSLFSI